MAIDNRLNIVFILPGAGVSGGVRVTVDMANKLIARGHRVRLFVRKQGGGMLPLVRRLTDRIIWSAHSWTYDFRGPIEVFRDIKGCRFERSEIVVGVGMWASNELGRLSLAGNPRVQYIHGATPWDPGLMEATLAQPLPKIVVASYLKPLAESLACGQVLSVIHNGIDQKDYFCSVAEGEKTGVGTIFSSHPAKDPATVVASLARIASMRPDVPLRVFGTERKPKSVRVLYWRYPSVAKARDLYSRSRIWIMGSMSEGFPAPILEAMACGAVVVATDCGGVRDIIIDGENGFLVPVGDVDQIVVRVLLLLNDDRLRQRMRQAGEETAKQFTWEKAIDQLEAALLSLGGQSASPSDTVLSDVKP